jgi:magnesium-transporting ATPase (P-type)
MLYQTTIALNMSLFLLIGLIRFKETPVSPSTILWLNFVMDTMAGIIFGSELPDQSVPRITPRPEDEDER